VTTVGRASRKRRAVTSAVTGACRAAGWAPPTESTLRPDRSGNVTVRRELSNGRTKRAAVRTSRHEECFQQAKGEAGLDHYQVRTWRAWYAYITLSMLALAWLAASRATAVKKGAGTSDPGMIGYTLQYDPLACAVALGWPGAIVEETRLQLMCPFTGSLPRDT
jgi:hypothetical protein